MNHQRMNLNKEIKTSHLIELNYDNLMMTILLLDEMGSSDEESNSEIEDNRTKRVTRSSKLKRRKVVKDGRSEI